MLNLAIKMNIGSYLHVNPGWPPKQFPVYKNYYNFSIECNMTVILVSLHKILSVKKAIFVLDDSV